jgi:hypothetical protein
MTNIVSILLAVISAVVVLLPRLVTDQMIVVQCLYQVLPCESNIDI